MISIKNLTISYAPEKKIIDSLSLNMEEGKIHGIVGLNGTGKTTLLNAIYGLKKYDSGEILLNNEKLTKINLSYLVTDNYFYSNITGKEYLNLFKNPDFDAEMWNKLFLLPLNDITDIYSTGMKKKLAMMGVLKQNKQIMILDEPFNGLDFETSRILRSVLLRLKENDKTILVTSHIIETLTNLCDYIHYLENGKIKYSKEKHEFSEFEKELFSLIKNKNEELINNLIHNKDK